MNNKSKQMVRDAAIAIAFVGSAVACGISISNRIDVKLLTRATLVTIDQIAELQK